MGLFSNNKKVCPICGNPTPRLLPTKVEGTPICKECAGKIDLPDGALNTMSMPAFEQYIAYHTEVQPLRDRYTETFSYSFSFFGGSISLDTDNRLFRLHNNPAGLVMDASNLKKFRILEGSKPLFEGTTEALRVYDTGIEDRVTALQPQISQYLTQKRQMEFMERMERRQEEMMGDRDRDGDGRPDYRPTRTYTPNFDVPVPFQKFHVELTLDHPYWKSRTWEVGAPTFDRNYPSIDAYLNEYKQKSEELHALALNLMQILNPNAREISEEGAKAAVRQAMPVLNNAAAPVQAVPVVNTVEEIKKYKELLDAGIITEEEFTAKKRQLLGI